MHPSLRIAVEAAHQAGKLIVQKFQRVDLLTISQKAHSDFVTEVDQAAEQLIIQRLKKSFPTHAFLAEESGETRGKDDEYVWIIDPLDGTTNFIHGFPHFAVSIALQHKGKLEQAVIYDPIRHEFFTASRGHGALLNDRKMRVSNRVKLEDTLLGLGFPFRNPEKLAEHLAIFTRLFPITGNMRRAGSAALDMAYVASGRLDGYWEGGVMPWDIAAGVLLVQEAGGMVSDYNGSDHYLKTNSIITGNPKIFKALLEHIQASLLVR